jgi:hypothetical protein
MALVQFSGMVNSMIGKLGGSIMQRYGPLSIIKNNKNWNRLNSSNWQEQKQRLHQLSATWRTLSPADRAQWSVIAPDYPTTDPYGNPRTPSGFELFMRLNLALNFVGIGTISPPASPGVLTDIGAVSINTGAGLSVIPTWTNNQTNQEYVNFYATRPMSSGVSTPTGGYCFIDFNSDETQVSKDISSEYYNRYGIPVSGQQIFIKFNVLNVLTGQLGTSQYASAIFP